MRVYISSTSLDLKEYRKTVIDKLRLASENFTLVCMDNYAAQDSLPVEKCQADVASCSLYLGILAWRYGFIPEGYGRSITELEYRKAKEMGIPTLVFVLDEMAAWPEELRDGGEQGARIRALREEVCKNNVVRFFKDPHELAADVVASVHRITEINDAYVGAISPSEGQQKTVQDLLSDLFKTFREQAEREPTREPIPNPLPTARAQFVDREEQRRDLRDWPLHHDQKILLVVAPGGFGKTELANQVLKEFVPSTSIINEAVKGILYLGCVRGELTLGQVFDDAGRMTGRREEFQQKYASRGEPLRRKLNFFFGELSKLGRVWIVMDNFEDLLGDDARVADPELREFLEFAVSQEHTVRILVTSRIAPDFGGNRPKEEVLELDLSTGLPDDEAVAFLREAGEKYGLADADESLLRAFVRRVYAIPKALESVLGYLEGYYPEISLAQLMEDPEFFADFDRHDKERGLKSLVDKQYARQSPEAKLVLCALSIFPQPVPKIALRFLLPGISAVSFAKLLSRLEKNRLVISHNAETYDLHPIVREYVYQSMPEGQGSPMPDGANDASVVLTRAALHARAVAFYRKLVEEHRECQTLSDFEPHLQEIYHLLRAHEYDAAAQAVETISGGYLRAWGDYPRIIGLRQQLVERLTNPIRAWTNVNNLAVCFDIVGRVRDGIAYYQDALRIVREIADQPGEATCLSNLGYAYNQIGELAQAVDYCTQALALDRKLFNRWGEGIDLGTLGWSHWHLGKLQEAIELYTAAIDKVDRSFKGLFLSNLGRIHLDLGDVQRAIENLQESADIARAEKNWETLCLALADLGYAWLVLGDQQRSAGLAKEALELAHRIPLPRGELRAQLCLGRRWSLAGEVRSATEAYIRATEVAQETGDMVYLPIALCGLGRSYHQDGNLAEARRCYRDSLARNFPRCNFRSTVLLGIACLEQDAADPASEHLACGLDFCRAMIAKTPQFYDAWYHLGLAQLALGQNEAALAGYRRAVEVCSGRGAVDGAVQDLRLLGRARDCGPAISEVIGVLESASARVA